MVFIGFPCGVFIRETLTFQVVTLVHSQNGTGRFGKFTGVVWADYDWPNWRTPATNSRADCERFIPEIGPCSRWVSRRRNTLLWKNTGVGAGSLPVFLCGDFLRVQGFLKEGAHRLVIFVPLVRDRSQENILLARVGRIWQVIADVGLAWRRLQAEQMFDLKQPSYQLFLK